MTIYLCPAPFKKTEIVPTFKASDKHNFNNYKPISIISNFTKIFEIIPHDRILKFIE